MTTADRPTRPILLTGATGFVGRHLRPALAAAGLPVRCGAREPAAAVRRWPDAEWVPVDVAQPHTLEAALAGCGAAYYLVHSIGQAGYAGRESAEAHDFRAAAAAAGVERIVYLGGVAPAGAPSRHLGSRLATGEVLRGGTVPTVELRSSMVIGKGSASWRIVEELAARLPAMVLPRWLRNRSAPVAIDDVVVALLAALDIEPGWRGWLDLPGPEVITHRDLLRQVARQLGHDPPMLSVPVLSPRLSSYWIGLVTSADLKLAQELVEGLRSDLLPHDEGIWRLLPELPRVGLADAIAHALADRDADDPSPATLARLAAIGTAWAKRRRTLHPG